MYFICNANLRPIWRGANPIVCTRKSTYPSIVLGPFPLFNIKEPFMNQSTPKDNDTAKHVTTTENCKSNKSPAPEKKEITTDPEHLEQKVLRQGPVLRILMQYLPVASGGLVAAAQVSRAWYDASTAHINSLGRTLIPPGSTHSTITHARVPPPLLKKSSSRLGLFMPPNTFLSVVLTRTACRNVLHIGKLPNLLRVFHYINSWTHSDTQIKRLLLVLGSQRQIRTDPLLIDSYLAASPKAAHIAYIWSTIESLLERDAKAVLAHLSTSIANHMATGNFTAGDSQQTSSPFMELDHETMVLEGWQHNNISKKISLALHRLRKINHPMLMNVYNWTVCWLGMLQHPKCIPADPTIPKPSILSAQAIDIALHRVFYALDNSCRLAWESMLHQILRCINKWTGITHAMAQILESIEEHALLAQQVVQAMP